MNLYDIFLAPFIDFAFMRRALVGTVILAAGSVPLGVLLKLRRMSLMGDAMSHAILPGVAAGFLLAGLDLVVMTLGGLMAGLVVVLMAGLVSRVTILKEDASLTAFYLIALAMGVVILSLKGSPIDLMHILFGTVLALNDGALLFIALTASLTILALSVLWRPLVLECADPSFLRLVSGMGALAHAGFLVLIVLNLVAGFQALGTLLAVGLMMLPALASSFLTRSLGAMAAIGFFFAVVSAYAGLIFSYHLGLPSGPAIITTAGLVYLSALLLGPVGGLLPRLLPRRHRAA